MVLLPGRMHGSCDPDVCCEDNSVLLKACDGGDGKKNAYEG